MRLYRVSPEVLAEQRRLGQAGQTDRLHYVYRCKGCMGLITKLEILESRYQQQVNLCACGGRTVSPTNAKWWEELLYPKLWKLIIAIYTKQIAPAPMPLSSEDQAAADRVGRAANREFDRKLSALLKHKDAVK